MHAGRPCAQRGEGLTLILRLQLALAGLSELDCSFGMSSAPGEWLLPALLTVMLHAGRPCAQRGEGLTLISRLQLALAGLSELDCSFGMSSAPGEWLLPALPTRCTQGAHVHSVARVSRSFRGCS